MNHTVDNVTKLHEDATKLYSIAVVGGGDSCDNILAYLSSGISTLKNEWIGVDAGVQINSLISVYNAMVQVRNALAQLAVDSSAVAANYREIQRANGAISSEALSPLSFESMTTMSDYSDTRDTIGITPAAKTGQTNINDALVSLSNFAVIVPEMFSAIMDNWKAGTGRDNAIDAFTSFGSNVSSYKEILDNVSKNITQALSNYGL